MRNLKLELMEETLYLEKVIKTARERIAKAPQGNLRIAKKRSVVEYYLTRSDIKSKSGKYIKKKDIAVAYKLAQRDYDMQVLKMAEVRLRAVKEFVDAIEKTDLRKAYGKASIDRRQLIGDAILTDEEYVKRWEEKEYEGKRFGPGDPEIFTERGERVRSKSEKIIADKLYSLGIPYKYECPIKLKSGEVFYPDFTLLDVKKRREVYLEHFGLMDNLQYVEIVVKKINAYGKNSVLLGDNLLATFENGHTSLNTQMLEEMIQQFCR